MRTRFVLSLASAILLAGSLSAAAQTPNWDATGLQLTRAELQDLLRRFEETAQMEGYSADLRRQAAAEAAIVRQRLEEGDLRVGDRVALTVENHAALTDTFNVVAGREIVLPEIGPIPLAGVLRSELQEHLTAQIGRFIRQPVVRARSLIRLEIMGAVGRAGFYTMPSDILLSDALMVAGGPQDAALDRMRIERGDEVIWGSERLREAIVEGRTLDQLSLRAGDTILVPEERSRLEFLRNAFVVLSAIGSIVLIAERAGLF